MNITPQGGDGNCGFHGHNYACAQLIRKLWAQNLLIPLAGSVSLFSSAVYLTMEVVMSQETENTSSDHERGSEEEEAEPKGKLA